MITEKMHAQQIQLPFRGKRALPRTRSNVELIGLWYKDAQSGHGCWLMQQR